MPLRASLEKKEEKEKVRNALLRAALRLAATHGFSSLGLREVSREAGIAPTSFYRHFADMEELGKTLIRELGGTALREIGQRARAASGATAVAALVDAMLAAVVQDPELMRFVLAERTGAIASFRASMRTELAELASALETALKAGGPASHTPPPRGAEAAIKLLIASVADVLDDPEAARSSLRDSLIAWMTTLVSKDGTS